MRRKRWLSSTRAPRTYIAIPTAARFACAKRWLIDRKCLCGHIILGNGSDEILGLFQTFLSPGDEAVIASHTFVIYKMEVMAAHGKPVAIPLKQWRHDLSAMADAITARTRLLFLCNPNNPTGTMVSAEEVARLLARVPEHASSCSTRPSTNMSEGRIFRTR